MNSRYAKYILDMWEVLDNIMICFFELGELTFGFTVESKDKYLIL